MLLYGLGLRELDELEDMITSIMKKEEVKNESKPLEYTYDELMNVEFKLVDATSLYKYNSKYDKMHNDIPDIFVNKYIVLAIWKKEKLSKL